MARMPKKAGVYADVPFEEYLGWTAINNSSLGPILPPHGSPAIYRQSLDSQKEDTPSLRLGRLTHHGKLEPALLLQKYWVLDETAVWQQCRTAKGDVPATVAAAKRTRGWSEIVADLQAANAGKEPITQSELDKMCGMCAALADHPDVRDFVRQANLREASWLRPLKRGRKTVEWLKGRIDLVGTGWLGDLKTCHDISDRGIQRAIVRYGYHRQAAFYLDAWRVLNGIDGDWPFYAIFVQPEPPHTVRFAPFSASAIDQGRADYEMALELIMACRAEDRWPGHQSPKCWDLPSYALNGVEVNGEEVYA